MQDNGLRLLRLYPGSRVYARARTYAPFREKAQKSRSLGMEKLDASRVPNRRCIVLIAPPLRRGRR